MYTLLIFSVPQNTATSEITQMFLKTAVHDIASMCVYKIINSTATSVYAYTGRVTDLPVAAVQRIRTLHDLFTPASIATAPQEKLINRFL